MKHNVMLTIASLLSILFLTFHLTDDIVRGMEKGGGLSLLLHLDAHRARRDRGSSPSSSRRADCGALRWGQPR